MIRKLAAAAILALSACATPEQTGETTASADRDCFRAQDVNGYSVVDENRVKASVGVSREYYLTIPDTSDLDWSRAIVLTSPTSFICVGGASGARLVGGEPSRQHIITRVDRAPDPVPAGS